MINIILYLFLLFSHYNDNFLYTKEKLPICQIRQEIDNIMSTYKLHHFQLFFMFSREHFFIASEYKMKNRTNEKHTKI